MRVISVFLSSSLSICFMIDLNARQLSDQSWDKWLRLDITLRTLHLRIKKTHVRMRILYCRFNIDDCDVSLKAARVYVSGNMRVDD